MSEKHPTKQVMNILPCAVCGKNIVKNKDAWTGLIGKCVSFGEGGDLIAAGEIVLLVCDHCFAEIRANIEKAGNGQKAA